MVPIFISYRRADSAPYTGRLHDALADHFGPAQIFLDVNDIEAGEVFPDALSRALNECRVLLAIIGPQWVTIEDAKGNRRLENPKDFVRCEIATAIKRSTATVIPVLVGGASMPDPHDLPSPLKPLTKRNGLELLDSHFIEDTNKLIARLEALGISPLPSNHLTRSALRLKIDAAEASVKEWHERFITIGRNPRNHVVVSDDTVSWEHGQILREGEGYVYRHLSKTNPTILQRKGEEFLFTLGGLETLPLRNRDRLIVGSTVYTVEFDLVYEDGGYIETEKKE